MARSPGVEREEMKGFWGLCLGEAEIGPEGCPSGGGRQGDFSLCPPDWLLLWGLPLLRGRGQRWQL